MLHRLIDQYCIVRGEASGVFAGTLVEIEGRQAHLQQARRLWSWAGAASLSQLAACGTSNPAGCKFCIPCEVYVLDAIEILPVSAEGVASIKGVPQWKE